MTLDREFLHSLGSPGLVIGHAFGIYIFGSPVINWIPLVFLIPSSKFRIPNSQSNIQHQIRYNPLTPFSNHPEYSGDSPAGEGGIYLYHSTSTIENVPVTAKIPPGRHLKSSIQYRASSIQYPASSIFSSTHFPDSSERQFAQLYIPLRPYPEHQSGNSQHHVPNQHPLTQNLRDTPLDRCPQ